MSYKIHTFIQGNLTPQPHGYLGSPFTSSDFGLAPDNAGQLLSHTSFRKPSTVVKLAKFFLKKPLRKQARDCWRPGTGLPGRSRADASLGSREPGGGPTQDLGLWESSRTAQHGPGLDSGPKSKDANKN